MFNFTRVWATGARLIVEAQEEYHRAAEAGLQSERDRFSGWYRDEIAGLSEDQVRDFEDYFSQEGVALSVEFPRIHRRSIFVTCWSQMEVRLIQLCRLISHWKVVPITFERHKKDTRDRGVQLGVGYVDRVTGAAIKSTGLWGEEVKPLNELRNAFVHRDGEHRPAEDTSLEGWIRRQRSLVSVDGHDLRLEDGFLQHVFTVERRLFEDVANAVEPWATKAADAPRPAPSPSTSPPPA